MKFLVLLATVLAVTVAVTFKDPQYPQPQSPETFLISGNNATHTPHHVMLEFVNAANLGFFGGGSIITRTHILTSAQNVHGFISWRVGFGHYRRQNLTWMVSTNAISHPQYVPATRNNDIAIITLPQQLIFTARVHSIPLPIAELELPYLNEQGRIIGFGFTDAVNSQPSDNLRYGFVRILPDLVCSNHFPIQAPNHFCASDHYQNANICYGDIGGGLTTYYRRVETLVGVSSIVYHSCYVSLPSAFTRVTPYLGWIQQVTGGV